VRSFTESAYPDGVFVKIVAQKLDDELALHILHDIDLSQQRVNVVVGDFNLLQRNRLLRPRINRSVHSAKRSLPQNLTDFVDLRWVRRQSRFTEIRRSTECGLTSLWVNALLILSCG
jgi:hypothetical protein